MNLQKDEEAFGLNTKEIFLNNNKLTTFSHKVNWFCRHSLYHVGTLSLKICQRPKVLIQNGQMDKHMVTNMVTNIYRPNHTDGPVRPVLSWRFIFIHFSLFHFHIFLTTKQQFICMTINWIAIVKCMKSIISSTTNYQLNFSLKVILSILYPFDAYFRPNSAKIEIPML